MANILLAVAPLNRTPTTPAFITPLTTTDVYRVPNTGKTIFRFKKTGAGDCVITFRTPGQIGGLDIAESAITVPNTSGDIALSGFDPALYNVGNTGYLEFTLSDILGLSAWFAEPGQ